jgi:hypothetical protein
MRLSLALVLTLAACSSPPPVPTSYLTIEKTSNVNVVKKTRFDAVAGGQYVKHETYVAYASSTPEMFVCGNGAMCYGNSTDEKTWSSLEEPTEEAAIRDYLAHEKKS